MIYGNKQVKQQIINNTMFYQSTEISLLINSVVLTYISIVVLTCCRTVVWKYRFISIKI